MQSSLKMFQISWVQKKSITITTHLVSKVVWPTQPLFWKNIFLDCSGVFWGQLNYSFLFSESSILRKNQCICSIRSKCQKIFPSVRKNFSWNMIDFSLITENINNVCINNLKKGSPSQCTFQKLKLVLLYKMLHFYTEIPTLLTLPKKDTFSFLMSYCRLL